MAFALDTPTSSAPTSPGPVSYTHLFGGGEEEEGPSGAVRYPDLEEYPVKKLLAMEKECIGFYISGHPLDEFADEVRQFSTITAADIAAFGDSGDDAAGDYAEEI